MEPFASTAYCLKVKRDLKLKIILCELWVKFQNWKIALELFVNYESTKYHRNSVLTTETITTVLSGQQDSIAIQLDHQRKTQILENQRRIIPIIKTIILCGRHRIPL